MTDRQILNVIDTIDTLPSLTEGRRQYVHYPELDVILFLERVGKNQRWSWAPTGGTFDATAIPTWWPAEVRAWVARRHVSFTAQAQAMGARTL
jgi:hypothetical protein